MHNLGGISGRTAAVPEQLVAVKMAIIAFWDAHLKNDAASNSYPKSDKFDAYTQNQAILSHK